MKTENRSFPHDLGHPISGSLDSNRRILVLFHKRISSGRLAHHISKGIYRKEVLGGIGETSVAVTIVEVNHTVFFVGPDHREIPLINNIFYAERIVFLRKGCQDLNIRIISW